MDRTVSSLGPGLLALFFVVLCGAVGCESRPTDPAQLCRSWAPQNGFVSGEEHARSMDGLKAELAALQRPKSRPSEGEGEAYELRVDASGVKPKTGGVVHMGVVPTDPWHVNLAFPTSMTWQSVPGLELNEGKFTKTEVRVIDGGGLGFELPISAAKPGTHKLQGRFKFAVCAEGADCLPVRHDFEIEVEVGASAP